ncbi:MAG: PIN domain-containing protein [Acidobacteriota bacterium]
MRSLFADTSAFYALLDRDDRFHGAASRAFAGFEPDDTSLVTSSYVVLETLALLQHRIGLAPVRRFRAELQPILDIVWVGAPIHDRALAALIAASRRGVSLTDWTSFEIMRERDIEEAFSFDPDFEEQGFQLVPAAP